MNRKTLTALAAFALLGVVTFFALRAPEKGERPSDKPRPIAKLSPGDADTLEVTRQGATATIKKDGAKYKVTAPVAYAADENVAKAAFEAIDKLDFAGLVTEQKAKQTEFEVDDAKGVHVIVKGKEKVLADLIIGKSTGSGTMVRPAGKDEIWQASGSLRYMFDKAPADWRDKSIAQLTAADAERIDIKARDGAKVSLKKSGTKEGSEDKWEATASSVKIDKLDSTVANGIVSSLASFRANDFADGVKAADAGLEPPALTVTVSLKGGKSATVLVGGKKGEDDYYVKTPEAPQVYLVKKYAIERLAKRPIELRDKTLCNIADTELAEISVVAGDKSYAMTRSSSDWKATKPPKLEVDASKVSPVASAFRDWKATSFAEGTSPKDAGLVKPKAVISGKPKSGTKGQACTVRVGDETKDKQSYYVQTARTPDLFLAPKWAVDRFLVKPDDLAKAGSTNVAKK